MTAATRLGPAVMGTGIVSIALSGAGATALSWIWLGLAAGLWVLLALALAGAVAKGPGAPAVGELSVVAATAVIASRLERAGSSGPAFALLVLAGGAGLAIGARLTRRATVTRRGSSFLLTVAPASLGVLAASLAQRERLLWLWWLALVACLVGLAAYAYVLSRFDLDELRSGRGDHWVAGGALAISTLGFAELSRYPGIAGHPALHAVSVILWAASIAWLLALVACELGWPRPSHHPLRWSTVFPVGMYAAASFEVAQAAHLPALDSFARAWTWIAVAVWGAVAAGAARRMARRAAPRAGRY